MDGTYLVTGCASFIGSHLADDLLAGGARVVGIDSFLPNYASARKRQNLRRALDHDSFELVELDLADPDAELRDLVGDANAVFHLAGEPGVRTSWGSSFESYLRNNVLATQRLLEAAKLWPEKRFVFTSSSSVYGEADELPVTEEAATKPFSPYGATKHAAEELCRVYHENHGVEAVMLRYFSVYGPRQRPDMGFERFCHAALRGEPIRVFGDGRQTRDFTYVSDAIGATRAAAEAPSVAGRVYNIGGDSCVSVNDALTAIARLTYRVLDVHHLEREYGDVRYTAADTSLAREELGLRPSVSLEEGLRRQIEWALAPHETTVSARGATA
ncbi:MAG TPA: NAD-dependent epimerase/dehydratase family protein [Thermoleophilaceae bacterium]